MSLDSLFRFCPSNSTMTWWLPIRIRISETLRQYTAIAPYPHSCSYLKHIVLNTDKLSLESWALGLSCCRESGFELLRVLDDVDRLLATCDQFLLGRWVESAKSHATNEEESKLYEYNARNQITLWGPSGNVSEHWLMRRWIQKR